MEEPHPTGLLREQSLSGSLGSSSGASRATLPPLGGGSLSLGDLRGTCQGSAAFPQVTGVLGQEGQLGFLRLGDLFFKIGINTSELWILCDFKVNRLKHGG